MRNKEPELFEKACDLENLMRERGKNLGVDIWFTTKRKPLAMATTELVQGSLFGDDDVCESEYCFM